MMDTFELGEIVQIMEIDQIVEQDRVVDLFAIEVEALQT